jgi:hypothetical protein
VLKHGYSIHIYTLPTVTLGKQPVFVESRTHGIKIHSANDFCLVFRTLGIVPVSCQLQQRTIN